ncbi:Ankyrin repeat protein 1 [Giardia muris]|uniref:Ankyrin repeat protein 1 n=1 Tax=Giardia muris TaxID=5742 RepID=A0A4Z1SWJ5_GIAMU|nr:Ankyrin repeat protein 1 [Giardia muris]|eukprot:TNJ30106.1 Ankyrin repeat protein 1 [Giardia muris]
MSATNLMLAAKKGDAQGVVEHLDEAGKRGPSEATALMYAVRYGHTDCVCLLAEKEGGMQLPDGRTALMQAIELGFMDCVEALVGVEAQLKTDEGLTALMYAAYNNNVEAAVLLMDREAGIQTEKGVTFPFKMPAGMTALMIAASRGATEIVALLHLSEVCRVATNGWTALMWAVRYGHHECARLLAQREMGYKSATGMTALIIAARVDSLRCARLLTDEAGEKTTRKTKMLGRVGPGLTALMVAAMNGFYEVAQLLAPLELGVLDCKDRTARWYALQNRFPNIADLLADEGDGLHSQGLSSSSSTSIRSQSSLPPSRSTTPAIVVHADHRGTNPTYTLENRTYEDIIREIEAAEGEGGVRTGPTAIPTTTFATTSSLPISPMKMDTQLRPEPFSFGSDSPFSAGNSRVTETVYHAADGHYALPIGSKLHEIYTKKGTF